MIQYYVIDTETTGLDAKVHEVTQISIVRCKDKHQLSKYIKAEHPERAAPQALKITNRTVSDLLTGEDCLEVAEFCEKFFEEDGLTPEHRCIIAHNASFDRRFLHAMWKKLKKTFPAQLWLCTKEFSRGFAVKNGIIKPKLTLQASMDMVGIKSKPGAHNAIVDTQNAYLLWEGLMYEKVDYLPHIKRVPHILE